MTRRSLLGVAVAALLVYPVIFGQYGTDLLSLALVYGLFAVSLDVQWGFTGILNLAPAASFGLGAYAYVLILRHDPGALLPALALSVACPVALALIVGYTSFRARATQIYFALITLAAGVALERLATVWYGFTGGSNGLVGVTYPGFVQGSPGGYLYFCGLLAALGILASRWLVRSAGGSVWIALRENETRAAALGYPVEAYKLVSLGFSSGLAGLAGALVTPLVGMAHPSLFGILLSLQAFVWVAVGGQGTLWGPFLGALAVTVSEAWLSGVSASFYLLALGVLFTLTVIFLPGGFAEVLARLTSKRATALELERQSGA